MKLSLVNFKCWKKKKFEFPDKGLVLIQMPSGSGKSSIFQGIYFAIYGLRRNYKTYGEKSCKVKLSIRLSDKQELHIERQKGPSRLIVKVNDNIYENDVAQEFLNSRFGVNFELTSYMIQKGACSFVSLSASEKLAFLEKISFGNHDIDKIKTNTKGFIKQLKDQCLLLQGESNVLKSRYSEIKSKKVNKQSNPFPNQPLNYADTLSAELTVLENINTLDKLLILNKELNSIRNDKSQGILEKIQELKKIEIPITNEKELTTQLKACTQELESVKLYKTYIEKKQIYDTNLKTYETLEKKEIDAYDKELSRLNAEKFTFNDNSKSLEANIESLIIVINEIKRFVFLDNPQEYLTNDIKNEITTIKESISELKGHLNNKYCPKCKVNIKIVNGNLTTANNVLSKEELLKEIEVLKSKEEKLNNDLTDKIKHNNIVKNNNEIIKKVNTIITKETRSIKEAELKQKRKELTENNEKKNKLLLINNQIKNLVKYSDTLLQLKRKISDKPILIKQPELSEEEIIKRKTTIEINLADCKKNQEKKKEIDAKLANLQKELTKLSKLRKEQDCLNDIQAINDENTKNKQRITEIKTSLESIKQFKKYHEFKTEKDEWKSKIKKNEDSQKDTQSKLILTEKLYTKILESESMALNETISNINYYLAYFLEKFFDDDIHVELTSYKETKKQVKPTINLDIHYKEMKCDLNMLSGGEQDRLMVCFMLALNEIYGQNFLILDEALSSLDGDLVDKILHVLKEISNEKLILMVAHQTGEGMFDKIIS